jgi:O-antigen ligase
LFGLALAGAVAAGGVFLVFCFPTRATVVWLLVTSLSLEMTLHDLIGERAFQPTIAAAKGFELLLATVCVLRFGLRLDPLSPAWAFLAMLMTGLAHGLHPGLTAADSLRSAIGSASPFVFGFCRLPEDWPDAILRATKWCAVTAVAASLPFALAGVRPLFVESGGMRLAGLGHPAFLASVCLPAIYACLVALFRSGRRGDLVLLLLNGAILLLTGARAPLAYAAAVCLVSLMTIRSVVFPMRDRLLLILVFAAAVPVAAVLARDLEGVRVFNLFAHHATDLSGRDLLWPAFEAASRASPWFGWGVGAGNVIIPPTGHLAQALHTWAAHNEYLRIGVEGGAVGRLLLIGLFAAWVLVHTHGLHAAERRIMRLVFLALAAHAVTDNLLISTPACVMFAFTAAVFAQARDQGGPDPGRRDRGMGAD